MVEESIEITRSRAPLAAVEMAVQPSRAIGPKILLYSHDTFGLGNIHRTLLIAEALTGALPDAAVLIVTGSPVIHALSIPDGMDYVKLPCLDRIAAEHYRPRFLSSWSDDVKRMRRDILRKAALGFAPDLVIVDKRAAGVDGELLGTLAALRRLRRPPRIVLGLRDILDEPVRTRRALAKTHAFATIERYYDEVWVYGTPLVFDTVREYRFPEAVARKTVFCGYLRAAGHRAVVVPRAEPVREQLIRARRFAELGYFDLVEPGELMPDRLISQVLSALHRDPAPLAPADLGGLVRVVERVRVLLDGEA